MKTPSEYPPALRLALDYISFGLWVFPIYGVENGKCMCRRKFCPESDTGKHPIYDRYLNRNGFRGATNDPAKAIPFFLKYKGCNIGIRTGSNIMVLDIDGSRGSQSLDTLEQKYEPLPVSWTVTSGRGDGKHIYLRIPKELDLRCSQGKVDTYGPGLDVRANGGYIVAPPSEHKSGRQYLWDDEYSPEEIPLADAPDWLITEVSKRCKTPNKREKADICREDVLPFHFRNSTLYSDACHMRDLGLSKRNVHLYIGARATNPLYCNPVMTPDEVDRLIDSAFSYPVRRPGIENLSRTKILNFLLELSVSDGCSVGRDEIAKAVGISDRQVKRSVRQLEQSGLLEVVQGGGRDHKNLYYPRVSVQEIKM